MKKQIYIAPSVNVYEMSAPSVLAGSDTVVIDVDNSTSATANSKDAGYWENENE